MALEAKADHQKDFAFSLTPLNKEGAAHMRTHLSLLSLFWKMLSKMQVFTRTRLSIILVVRAASVYVAHAGIGSKMPCPSTVPQSHGGQHTRRPEKSTGGARAGAGVGRRINSRHAERLLANSNQ